MLIVIASYLEISAAFFNYEFYLSICCLCNDAVSGPESVKESSEVKKGSASC